MIKYIYFADKKKVGNPWSKGQNFNERWLEATTNEPAWKSYSSHCIFFDYG